jgi:hypothetical protein
MVIKIPVFASLSCANSYEKNSYLKADRRRAAQPEGPGF